MKRLFPAVVLVAGLLPSVAVAHPGHEFGGFAAGVLHPFGGLDHLLAMLAVGLWAAQASRMVAGWAVWAMPLTFVLAMLAGGAVASPLPGVEPMILASVILLGAAVAMARAVSLVLALPLLALFGAAHGMAHAAEGPAGAMVPYAAGFVLATGGLHLAGLAAGLGLQRLSDAVAPRLLGGATFGAGLVLALA